MNQFISLIGETYTVLCCGEDWHPGLDEEFVCPKCGRHYVWAGRVEDEQ